LVDDIGALKPTIFCAVPRVLDRIYSGKLQIFSCLHSLIFITSQLFCHSAEISFVARIVCQESITEEVSLMSGIRLSTLPACLDHHFILVSLSVKTK
jgi:hypothetical protein